MKPTADQLKARSISPKSFDSMVRRGWLDPYGNSKVWYDWQRPNHDAQFAEERDRKPGKKKFVKKER